jgi:hypothetical protein
MLVYAYLFRQPETAFVVNHKFKVSLLAICVPTASAIFKETDIFNKDYISLMDIINIACSWIVPLG